MPFFYINRHRIFTITIEDKKINSEQQNETILIVDDDKSLLELLAQVMELYNINYETANNGLEALEKIKNKFYPLILSDIRMPEMTGTELLKSLRELQKEKDTQSAFILMTAYTTKDLTNQAHSLKVDDFISKPFDISTLTKKIMQFLNR